MHLLAERTGQDKGKPLDRPPPPYHYLALSVYHLMEAGYAGLGV
jgi:hypothetical protein